MEIEEELAFVDMYNQLSTLRFIETRLSPLIPIFSAHHRLLDRLSSLNADLLKGGAVDVQVAQDFVTALSSIEAKIQTLDSNAKFLLSRITSITQMVSSRIHNTLFHG